MADMRWAMMMARQMPGELGWARAAHAAHSFRQAARRSPTHDHRVLAEYVDGQLARMYTVPTLFRIASAIVGGGFPIRELEGDAQAALALSLAIDDLPSVGSAMLRALGASQDADALLEEDENESDEGKGSEGEAPSSDDSTKKVKKGGKGGGSADNATNSEESLLKTPVEIWDEVVRWKRLEECCVKSFQYPSSLTRSIEEVTRPEKGPGPKKKGWKVTYPFTIEIEYKPKRVDSGCLCDCCEFKQFVLTDYSYTSLQSDGTATKHTGSTKGKFVEDCLIRRRGGGRGSPSNVVWERSRGKSKKELQAEGWVVSGCFGSKPPHNIPNTTFTSDPGSDEKNCSLFIIDEPGFVALQGQPGYRTDTFLGIIFDRCHGMNPKRAKKFDLYWESPQGSGKTDSGGGGGAGKDGPGVTSGPGGRIEAWEYDKSGKRKQMKAPYFGPKKRGESK